MKFKRSKAVLFNRVLQTAHGLGVIRLKRAKLIRADSRTDLLKIIRALPLARSSIRGAIQSGDCGILMAWVDDDRLIRAEFHQYRQVINAKRFTTLAALERWAREFWPKLCR